MTLIACIIAASIDSTTNVPLGYLFGFAATVFLSGCWVTAKASKIDSFKEQQVENVKILEKHEKQIQEVREEIWELKNRGRQ